MDLRKRFFGLAADRDDAGNVRVDVAALLDRLLLFDTYILHSLHLREIKALVELFGAAPVIELLRSDAIEIYCDAVFIAAETDEVTIELLNAGNIRIAPLRFGVGRVQRDEVVASSLREFEDLRMSRRHVEKLKEAASAKILPRPAGAGDKAFAQFKVDLEQHEQIHKVAARLITKRFRSPILNDLIELRFRRAGDESFEAATNLATIVKSAEDAAEIVGSAAMAVANLNDRIEKMSQFTCTVGTHEDDLPLLDEKLSVVAASLDPDAQVSRFQRVLQVANLPAIDPRRVKFERLLNIRNTRECREFRDWLWSSSALTDAEIDEKVTNLRNRIGDMAQSKSGRIIRWLAATGVGAIPGVGTAAGAVSGLLDTFVLDKVFPRSGVVTFLGSQYPSMFIKRETA